MFQEKAKKDKKERIHVGDTIKVWGELENDTFSATNYNILDKFSESHPNVRFFDL